MRADVAKLIADNLAELPGNGGAYKLPMYSVIGQHDAATIQRVEKTRKRIGEGVARLLEANGFTISHPSDPKPADAPGPKVVTVHCAHCGNAVQNLAVDDQMNATLHRVAMQVMGHPHLKDCPQLGGANA